MISKKVVTTYLKAGYTRICGNERVMLKEIIFLVFLMLSSYFLKAQNFVSGLKSKFPKLSITNSISALPTKPEIPYQEELKQIQLLNKSYDSLRRELRDLKEIIADSTQSYNLFTVVNERNREVLEQESKTLESLILSGDMPGEEIKNAANSTLDRVNESNTMYGLSYSISEQLALMGGVTWKKQFDNKGKLRREGLGMFTGLRFSKDNWFAQGSVNRIRVTISNPSGF